LGKDKGRQEDNVGKKERWNYQCRPKEAFTINEGALG
jgi:hypothetical protein